VKQAANAATHGSSLVRRSFSSENIDRPSHLQKAVGHPLAKGAPQLFAKCWRSEHEAQPGCILVLLRAHRVQKVVAHPSQSVTICHVFPGNSPTNRHNPSARNRRVSRVQVYQIDHNHRPLIRIHGTLTTVAKDGQTFLSVRI
jgi:hypothetical protein